MWILVGALIGAVAGAVGTIVSAKLRGQEIDWKDVGVAAVTGAVTGAVASATFGTGLLAGPVVRTVAGATIGAAAGALSTGLSNEVHGRPLTQGLANAVVAGAVGGALGGALLGPVAPELPAPTLVRTVVSGSAGNGAAQATENLLDGRPVTENLATAITTGALVAAGTQVAATRVAPQAEAQATTPRPTANVPAPAASEPLPAAPARPAPAQAEAAPPPARAPPAGSAPEENQKGVVQILERLEAPDPAASGPSGKPTAVADDGPAAPAAASHPDDLAGWSRVAGTPLGTSPRAGDLTGIAGRSIPEVLSRIPADAQVRELTPVEGGSQRGVEYKWTAPVKNPDGTPALNPDGSPRTATWRVRIHDADAHAGTGSNAGDGWVVRVQRGGQYMDDEGNFYAQNQLTPETKRQYTPRGASEPVVEYLPNPLYNPEAANGTHIPLAGNPHAPASPATGG